MVGKILIVDDVATNRIVMKVKLAAAGYQPLLVADGASCLEMLRQEKPDLILLDMTLPDMSGLEVLRQLRKLAGLQTVAVVMLASGCDPAARIKAFELGADDVLAKPVDDQTLMARIRSFMRARALLAGLDAHRHDFEVLGLAEPSQAFHRPALIAVLSLHPERSADLQQDLASHLRDRVVVMTPAEALGTEPAPDIFVLDADIDGKGSGLRLMSELRSRAATRHASICIVMPRDSCFVPAVAFDLGANDLVSAAVSRHELALRLSRLIARKGEEDRLRATLENGLRLAMIDPLTGLHNRRYGLAQLAAISASAQGLGQDFAVMVADLDRFKSVNDRFGHAAGDTVLIEVASRLAVNLRQSDLLARIGGEEFLIVLPATSLSEAEAIGRRLCEEVEQTAIALSGGEALHITVSIGLAVSSAAQPRPTAAQIIDHADRALLQAKSEGRNQVTIGRNAA
ncbi:diguanylate cyclase [Cypionkella sp.]|uniref:diguanylate cyclase n=1 Tax=Cypionkella sp. TaxID=2811411 RepID=UPI003751BF8E